MVARLNFAETVSTILDYNEQKVLQNVAELIHSSGFLMDAALLTKQEKADRFDRLNGLNPRPELTMLHATVNFAPGETLTKEQLSAIADRYMEGLRMQSQPYLVYQHYDAGHPHLHVRP